MIRIALVDDHAVFRKTLRVMLEQQPDLSVVAEAGDGIAAIEIVKQHQPDVLLIDVRLPKMDGFEATKIIKSQHPGTKVIVQTLFTDDGTRVKALEAGAYHCLAKEGHLAGMLAVIRECCQQPLRDALYNVTRSLSKEPDKVVVTRKHDDGSFKTFVIAVSISDHSFIHSHMDVIKSAAMRSVGEQDGERIVIHLVVNKDSLFRP